MSSRTMPMTIKQVKLLTEDDDYTGSEYISFLDEWIQAHGMEAVKQFFHDNKMRYFGTIGLSAFFVEYAEEMACHELVSNINSELKSLFGDDANLIAIRSTIPANQQMYESLLRKLQNMKKGN